MPILKTVRSSAANQTILSALQMAELNSEERNKIPKGTTLERQRAKHTQMIMYSSILAGSLIAAARNNLINPPK